MSIICRHIAALLSALLVLGPALEAQLPAASPDESIQELHLRVVEGGGTESRTGSLSDKSVVVAVTDGKGSPVPGVAVLFRLPGEGATGAFTDGTRVTIAYSDMQGLATISNIQWGSTPGPVVLRITATKDTAHAGILVPETLTANGGGSKHAKRTVEIPQPMAKPAQLKAMPAAQEPVTEPARLQPEALNRQRRPLPAPPNFLPSVLSQIRRNPFIPAAESGSGSRSLEQEQPQARLWPRGVPIPRPVPVPVPAPALP